jgi:hypothetical protein
MDRASMAFFWALRCPSLFPGVLGAEVDDARDGSWRRCFMTLLYLATKPAHVGIDLDGLAYPLHRPMAYDHQMRGHGLLPSWAPTTTSCCTRRLRLPLPEASGSGMLIRC